MPVEFWYMVAIGCFYLMNCLVSILCFVLTGRKLSSLVSKLSDVLPVSSDSSEASEASVPSVDKSNDTTVISTDKLDYLITLLASQLVDGE
uniref:Uncharacterized protein n=1 Tax=Dulem virus 179 TaxID=3145656 RepID=A0AAU8B815_9VIRU